MSALTRIGDCVSTRPISRHAQTCRPIPLPILGRNSRMSSRGRPVYGLGEDLLDYIEAGPKMRKWYGAADRPADGMQEGQQDPSRASQEEVVDQAAESGLVICVTDAESQIGEQIVLQLIQDRAEVKLMVQNTIAAATAYGPYVQPVSVNSDANPESLVKVLRGVKCLICLGRLGKLLPAAKKAGVQHILLLSSAGSPPPSGFLAGFFKSELAGLEEASREQAVIDSGLSYSIIRLASLDTSNRGGSQSVSFVKGSVGTAASGSISRQDLAQLVMKTAMAAPPPKCGRTFQVSNGGPGALPEDWAFLENFNTSQ